MWRGWKSVGALCSIASVTCLAGCREQSEPGLAPAPGEVSTIRSALSSCDRQFTVSFPAGVTRDSVVLASTGSLTVRDGVLLNEPAGGSAAVSNNGATILEVGADARTGAISSVGSVVLRDRARVQGNIRTSGTVTRGSGVVVTGTTAQHAVLTPPTTFQWSICFPASATDDVNLEPDAIRTLVPGSYRNLVVKSRAKLSLTSGTYTFRTIDIEPQGQLLLNKTNGPIALYVSDDVIFRGSTVDQGGNPDDFLIAYAGTNAVFLGGVFRGAFAAPNGRLVLTTVPTGFAGTFWAKDVEAQARMTITHRVFPSWDAIINAPTSKDPAGPKPSVVVGGRVLHNPPPFNTPADVPAFVTWASGSVGVEEEDARAAIQAASGNDAIAGALADHFRQFEFNDHARALVTLSILGEMRNTAGETFLTGYIHEPIPASGEGPFIGEPGEDAIFMSKARLMAKAVTGLAYRATTTSLNQVLWAVNQHAARSVRAEAIAAFLAWFPQGENAARTILGQNVRPDELIFIDRVRRVQGESPASFNAKLAAFLQKHPEVIPPNPIRKNAHPQPAPMPPNLNPTPGF
jgi:hypothetical protein